MCEKIYSCYPSQGGGGSAPDLIDSCEQVLKDQQKQADDQGCGDEFDDLYSCVEDEFDCGQAGVGSVCSDDQNSYDQCMGTIYYD